MLDPGFYWKTFSIITGEEYSVSITLRVIGDTYHELMLAYCMGTGVLVRFAKSLP